jgi:hypothetical protein
MVDELKVLAEMLGGLQGDTLAGVYVYLGVILTKFILSLLVGVYAIKVVVKLIRDSLAIDVNLKYRTVIEEAIEGSRLLQRWELCESHDWTYSYSDCPCEKCGAPSKLYRG